jgi:hypothetical protein
MLHASYGHLRLGVTEQLLEAQDWHPRHGCVDGEGVPSVVDGRADDACALSCSPPGAPNDVVALHLPGEDQFSRLRADPR